MKATQLAMIEEILIHVFNAGMPHETSDQLMDFIEKYVMTRLYRAVFCPVTTDDEERDLAIQTRIRNLHWINTHLLDAQINEMDDDVRGLVENAITGMFTHGLNKGVLNGQTTRF